MVAPLHWFLENQYFMFHTTLRLPDYPSTEPIISRYLFDSQSKELIYLGSRLNPRGLDSSLNKYVNTFYGIWA
jgi:hypothetical protein